MRLLVLGGSGMIGHQLLKNFSKKYETMATLRSSYEKYEINGIFNQKNSFFDIDVCNFTKIKNLIFDYKPNVIINAIGIIKQKINDELKSKKINSLFPKRLERLCDLENIRLIHLSTDCVFSGQKGHYTEIDLTDATDTYGKSKINGEITDNKNVLTIRKSTVGPELTNSHGLLEWFLSQKGIIHGYSKAIFTGISTLELARILEKIIICHKDLSGLFHISGPKISKLDLLKKMRVTFGKTNTNILVDVNFMCDRSLDGSKFFNETKYIPPSWDEMLLEIKGDMQ